VRGHFQKGGRKFKDKSDVRGGLNREEGKLSGQRGGGKKVLLCLCSFQMWRGNQEKPDVIVLASLDADRESRRRGKANCLGIMPLNVW